ncbi:MAG: fimbrillin family protein [Rikenellaceae bacterium]|nr:fimbrillin family protein [Rikenellaceae bacterium]
MKRSINKILFPAAVCIAALAGCAHENTQSGYDDPGEIRLKGIADSGAGTRVGLSDEIPVYLVAFNSGDMTQRYFEPTRITSATALDSSPTDLILNTARYYPLGDNDISLYAYVGSINSSYQMSLVAGDGQHNDFVLSNYGKRASDTALTKVKEGEGTPGSSEDPAEILQFRHVMTQLTVAVEVDESQSHYVDPEPELVEFEIDGVPTQGLYSIMAKEPDPLAASVEVATDNSTIPYQANLGVNYLVPNGFDLVGKKFSSLRIDDYVATGDDLDKFIITASNGESEMLLYPGYAYRLTLKIQKLELTGVVLEQVNWEEKSVNQQDPTYDPNVLTLAIDGGYDNSGDDKITKVVLHSNENRQYVGDASGTANQIDFVTLPADGRVDSVDLYTAKGLLIRMPIEALQYASNTLSFNLSKVGMLLADPANTVNSATNPYLVTTLVQFLNIEKDLGGYYRQQADIEIETFSVPQVSDGFTGFGTFTGVYDGNSHWIGNVDISGPGLFAENEGMLMDIRLYTGNMDLAGNTYAGSICGINRGLVYGCLNEASLFNATGTVGGIVGLNESGGRVVGCVNTGNIRAGVVLGGICGENRSTAAGTFVACLSIGNIFAGGTMGGVIGSTVDALSTVVIDTCFWLEGTFGSNPGGAEGPTGSGTVGDNDTSSLSPEKMRNGLADGETESDRVVNRLNAALQADADYVSDTAYTIKPEVTGITWPAVWNVNNIP